MRIDFNWINISQYNLIKYVRITLQNKAHWRAKTACIIYKPWGFKKYLTVFGSPVKHSSYNEKNQCYRYVLSQVFWIQKNYKMSQNTFLLMQTPS